MASQSQTNPVASAAPSNGGAGEYTALEGSGGEHYSGYTLLVSAYASIWLIIMVWFFMLWRKQTDLASRLDGLESAIARAEEKKKAAPKAESAA